MLSNERKLTHLCLVPHKRDLGKQCRTRYRCIWSGCTLYTGFSIKDKTKNTRTALKWPGRYGTTFSRLSCQYFFSQFLYGECLTMTAHFLTYLFPEPFYLAKPTKRHVFPKVRPCVSRHIHTLSSLRCPNENAFGYLAIQRALSKLHEPCHEKTNKTAFVQSDQNLRCPHEESLGPLSAQRRLIICPVWSESSLGTQIILLVLSWGGSHNFVRFAASWLMLLYWLSQGCMFSYG